MKKTGEKSFLEKRTAIIILWTLGIAMMVYLAIPLFGGPEKEKTETGKGLNHSVVSPPAPGLNAGLSNNGKKDILSGPAEQDQNSKKGAEAYIFVNINKKHFLTRFTTYIPEETADDNCPDAAKPAAGKTPVADIRKMIQPSKHKTKENKSEDFSIRPFPM